MGKFFQIGKNNLELEFIRAEVIHSNKYNQGTGLYVAHIFSNNLLHDLVFKMELSGEEYPVTIKNININAYPKQKVTLISVNKTVVAFIDDATEQYFYLTNNLPDALGLGLNIRWIIPVVIAVAICSFVFLSGDYSRIFLLIAVATVVLFWLYRWLYSSYVEKMIDKEIAT